MSTDATRPDPAAPAYYEINGDGTARLGDLGLIRIDDNRLIAYEECESVNASIGMALALAGSLPTELIAMLSSIQHDLFDLTTDLGTPTDAADRPVQITEGHIVRLGRALEHYGADFPPVGSFVLPGGTATAALLSQARVAALRAERACWNASHDHPDTFGQLPAQYLSHLSLLLSTLARAANAEHGDVMWRPMESVAQVTDQSNDQGKD